jgi:hypothetical protein
MVIISSCTIKYIPVKSENVIITDDYAVIKTKGWTFAAENKYWIKEPQNLTDYFTTFNIQVKNRQNKDMEIKSSDISLLDEDGNQFDVVSLDYIEKLLLPKQLEYLVISNIENEKLTDTQQLFEDQRRILEEWREAENEKLTDTQQLFEDQRRILEEWREAKKNLITYSLSFGKIIPGAKKSGFIFFPKLASSNKSCQLVYRNNKIQFVRGDKKDK